MVSIRVYTCWSILSKREVTRVTNMDVSHRWLSVQRWWVATDNKVEHSSLKAVPDLNIVISSVWVVLGLEIQWTLTPERVQKRLQKWDSKTSTNLVQFRKPPDMFQLCNGVRHVQHVQCRSLVAVKAWAQETLGSSRRVKCASSPDADTEADI